MRGRPAALPEGALLPQASARASPAFTLPRSSGSSLEPATPTSVAAPSSISRPASPSAVERRPIDAPPVSDHAPGPDCRAACGRNRTSAADRIAPCDAALAAAKPAVGSDYGDRSNFIAAARHAAQSAGRDVPAPPSCEIAAVVGKPTGASRKLCAWIDATAAALIVLGSLPIARIMLASSGEGELSRPADITPLASVPPSTVTARTGGSEPAFSVSSAAPQAGRPPMFPVVDSAMTTSRQPVRSFRA